MNEKIEIINTGESPVTTILLNGVDISELVSEVCIQGNTLHFLPLFYNLDTAYLLSPFFFMLLYPLHPDYVFYNVLLLPDPLRTLLLSHILLR